MNKYTKFGKIVIFSVLEALTIGLLWDFFFDNGQIVLASVLTFLLLAVEHIMARNTADGKNLFHNLKHRFGLQALLGATEIIFWNIWRLLHQGLKMVPGLGPIVGMAVFGTTMIAQHNAESNVNSDEGFFKRIFRTQGITISFVEAVTAMAWLFAEDAANNRVLALIPLVIGLVTEHVIREFSPSTNF